LRLSQIWEPNSISWVIIMFHVFLLKLDIEWTIIQQSSNILYASSGWPDWWGMWASTDGWFDICTSLWVVASALASLAFSTKLLKHRWVVAVVDHCWL
jgi:hypothetical protein